MYKDFFELVQKICLPGIWSKGMSLNRSSSIIKDKVSSDELLFRIQEANQPTSRKVSLWPNDEDWFCDCGDRNDVCAHVVAALVSLKASSNENSTAKSPLKPTAHLVYRFSKAEKALILSRSIRIQDKTQTQAQNQGQDQDQDQDHNESSMLNEILLTCPISEFAQKNPSTPISLVVTKEDQTIDLLLKNKKPNFDYSTWESLFTALSECPHVYLDSQLIQVSSKLLRYRASLSEEANGFRLVAIKDPTVIEIFDGGLALCRSGLKLLEKIHLTSQEQAYLTPPGKFFSLSETNELTTQILPSLQKKLHVDILTTQLSNAIKGRPRIILKTEKDISSELLFVTPVIQYQTADGHPILSGNFIPDLAAEKILARQIQNELQLALNQTTRFEGTAAIHFADRVSEWEIAGTGISAFSQLQELTPSVNLDDQNFSVSFNMENGKKSAHSKQVIQAWKSGQTFVQLLEGGWAKLPLDWLNKHGQRILQFGIAQENTRPIAAYHIPELIQLCEELNLTYPERLKTFKSKFDAIENIEDTCLPSDLTCTLRHYQQQGVNWLNLLGSAQMGALLADDMGLGKTIQALCAIQGKTLIVVPTSVLKTWSSQMTQFRPRLSQSLYYGPNRKLSATANVVLTSYAILRIDRDILAAHHWDTLILDESHIIKNSESHIAQASYALQATRKIALTGTPIENNLTDLWSQLNFLNPGLLGSREDFQENFEKPISRGDALASAKLKSKIAPFILRRLKKEVAIELPPRTETVLYCELSEEEREVYDSLLASSRAEVLQKLEMKSNVFAALELLLRLRQACCHISLVPGQNSKKSSKIELLLQTLKNSIEGGHRSLVFSQWTSYLDLIESELTLNGISFLRLDGSTQDRAKVIDEFQTNSKIEVMLISLKAGGIGITLTAADHIFLMDPWWNPSIEDQAADRAHRIGQKNPVLIHRLVAENTIEDKVLTLQKIKSELATHILESGTQSTPISREDLLELLK